MPLDQNADISNPQKLRNQENKLVLVGTLVCCEEIGEFKINTLKIGSMENPGLIIPELPIELLNLEIIAVLSGNGDV